jgi:hypothetical protein
VTIDKRLLLIYYYYGGTGRLLGPAGPGTRGAIYYANRRRTRRYAAAAAAAAGAICGHRHVCAARARLLRIVSHRAAAELGGTGDNRGLQPAMALAREYLGVPIGDPDAPRPPLLRP